MSISQYRADIDGLRAVAVLSVIIFHLNSAWMPSGFLGVDIFFVISGYLITSIIYRDLLRDSFSFKEFYLRRIKRILPAFFIVLFTSLLVGSYLMRVEEHFIALKKSAVASTFFAANLYFMRGVSYSDPTTEDKPFLHIWSLSVEEQFYFVFPILLILLLRYDWTRRNKYPILLALGGLTLGTSFINLADWGITWDPYYMPHLRVPEMLVGSLLAMASTDGLLKWTPSPIRASVYSLLCLCVVCICFYTSELFTPPLFPGIASLIPCISVTGLIYLNGQPTWVSRLLSNGFVVWIGKISYSLYLWHWVVLSWMRYVYGIGPLEPRQLVVAVILMTLLSVLSYYLVEQPTRHQRIGFGKSLGLYYLMPAILVLALYHYSNIRRIQAIPKEVYAWGKRNTGLLVETLEGDGLIGDKSKSPTVLIAGDSYTGHLDVFFDTLGKREGWSAYAVSIPGQPYFINYERHPSSQCYDLDQERDRVIHKNLDRYDVVILSAFWGGTHYYEEGFDLREGLDRTLSYLLARGKKVYVIYSGDYISRVSWKEYPLLNLGINLANQDFRGEKYKKSRAYSERIKTLVQEKYPQVSWIDLTLYIPQNLMLGSVPVLADNTHLNFYGAEHITRRFVEDGRRLVK